MKDNSLKESKSQSRTKHFIFITLLFILFDFFYCNDCNSGINLSNSVCFNGIIYFDHKNYRAGHFAENKNRDLIVEYSGDPQTESRLFFGLKRDGRGFFNDGYIREKDLTNPCCRYESRNLFVSKKTDIDKEKEYLFSTSSYISCTELHDLEANEVVTRSSEDFNEKRIFSYVFTILEAKISNNNYYFLLFTASENNGDNTGVKYVLKKFAFNNFDLYDYDNTNKKIESKFGDRVISGFILEEDNIIVIFFLKQYNEGEKVLAKYNSRYYNFDLNTIRDDIIHYNDPLERIVKDNNNIEYGDIREYIGVYANSVYLKGRTGLFIYFYKNLLIFQCFSFSWQDSSYERNGVFCKDFNEGYDSEITLNDLHKLSDERLAFATTKNSGKELYIILIDFYGSYTNIKFRRYKYNIFSGKKLKKELAVFSFRGEFLSFSSTIGQENEDKPYSSFLLFFGYPNGTDFIIDISPYFKDSENYNSTKNLYDDLMANMKIENNIFEYKKVDKIKLVSIPNEIIFRSTSDGTVIQNESFLDSNYELTQKTSELKNDDLYYLYYQYIVQEPTYEELYNSNVDISDGNYLSQYASKEFYGRTNKLSFKLCHEYCETCYTISISNNEQKCKSCLSDYTFDYLAYMNNFTGNCVPRGYMYDIEESELKLCQNYPHKFYYNTSRQNEKYCFKDTYDCPDVYHYLNETNKECLNYTPSFPTTIFTPIPSTIINVPTSLPKFIQSTLIKIPSTLPKFIPSTLIKVPSNLPNFIPSTLIKVPSTLPKYIPSTLIIIPTTLPENKPSTIMNAIHTTIPDNIATTTPIPIKSTLPLKITTTSPNIMTTIINNIPTTVIYICNYFTVYNQCIFTNLTNEEIYEKIKQDIVSTYPLDGKSVIVNGSNSFSFLLTNTHNENKTLNMDNDISSINLDECEKILKDVYHID